MTIGNGFYSVSFQRDGSSLDVKTISTGGDFTIRDAAEGFKSYCGLTAWRGRVPFTYWLPKYSFNDLRGDLVAGLTVGLTIVPQALAYVGIAELPLEMGLYSSFMGGFVYALFGTAKDLSLGPTSVMSLLTAASYPEQATIEDKVNCAILLAFYCGLVQLILGVFNLGFLVNFISEPVISAFTSASALVILYGQIKGLIGVKFGDSDDTVIEQTIEYAKSLKNIRGWDTLLGVVCLCVLLLMRDLAIRKAPRFGLSQKVWNIFREVVRNVKSATVLGYIAVNFGFGDKLVLTGAVKSGLPPFELPKFAWGNRTFIDTLAIVGPSVPFLILVGSLEAITVAKVFSAQYHYRIIPSQELVALGLANIVGSFFHAYPITGAFSRSALAAQSGVRTQMGSAWTSAFVLLAMAVISPAFWYIPKAALSAVIIVAVLILFDFKIFKELWHLSRKELIPVLLTIIISFTVGVDYGILAGVGVSLLLLLYPIARPLIVAQFRRETSAVVRTSHVDPKSKQRTLRITVTPKGALFFPAADNLKEFFQDSILEENSDELNKKHPETFQNEEIIFDGMFLEESDFTTLVAIKSIVLMCSRAKKVIRFRNTSKRILQFILPKEMHSLISSHGLQANFSADDTAVIVMAERLEENAEDIPRCDTSCTALSQDELA
ncbi:Sodium-independent sulfate anion transporter [Hypsibius exemplaris]|uniref:Sodium-independent sulfate anion transporter n=1 Tax=Hypsibius exemplaris TaxID=2072580 RepID=A0A1W0WBY1_HYPEX|nr:Sodium-independent sulfate anion transporter [Hypsibius exemplaris]